jgi:hypothetical protein
VAESDAGNADRQRHLAVALERFGVTVVQGNLFEAEQILADSLHIRQRLAGSDPGNAKWQRDLSACHSKIADLLEKQGDAMAPDHWRQAHDILAAIVQAGIDVSTEDRAVLAQLRAKIGVQADGFKTPSATANDRG